MPLGKMEATLLRALEDADLLLRARRLVRAAAAGPTCMPKLLVSRPAPGVITRVDGRADLVMPQFAFRHEYHFFNPAVQLRMKLMGADAG